MDGRDPITREREGETWKGRRYIVIWTNWNGVYQARRTNAQDQLRTQLWSRIERGTKKTEDGRTICIASLNIVLGQAGVWKLRYAHYSKETSGSESCRIRN